MCDSRALCPVDAIQHCAKANPFICRFTRIILSKRCTFVHVCHVQATADAWLERLHGDATFNATFGPFIALLPQPGEVRWPCCFCRSYSEQAVVGRSDGQMHLPALRSRAVVRF